MTTKRRAAPRPEFSIIGDEQERHRIQLEHNLQNKDLSIDLLSSQGDYSLEYARHAERSRSPFSYRSYGHHEHSVDDQSQVNPWSYRSVDDDDENGVNPYSGESLSTAAHHASAVTLNAGLGPRRGDDTRSGAEFDPERPLQNIMAGAERLSMFGNNTTSKSIQNNAPSMFDPLVVEDSVQLDMVLNTGHAPPHALDAGLRSPVASSSSSTSDSPHQSSRRPKLSDGLSQATFSPKRPRNAQAYVSPRTERSNGTRNGISHSPGRVSFDIPTPRAKSRSKIHPQVNVQPPTPTDASSKFTRMAKGLAREIESERERVQHRVEEDVAPTPLREKSRSKVMGRKGIVKPSSKSRIYLPDVTGLTSAVESPARVRLDYHRVNPADREIQKRIVNTLSIVQSKLTYLESEHNISRRRVQELESELEQCRKEVAKERTRVLQMEMEDVERQHAATMKAYADQKGKGKAAPLSPTPEDHARYREAVEEKKALEALVSSLRNHLTRFTSELTSHSALLAELRTLRDADTEALQAKSEEVNMLKDKVEGLAGEVEVLKGVVEEGLKERRMLREQTMAAVVDDQRVGHPPQAVPNANARQPLEEVSEVSSEESESEDESVEDSISASRSLLVRRSVTPDKTSRTDYATVGTQSQATRPFVTDEELERISVELSERRSERSQASSVAGSTKSLPRSLTYVTDRPTSPFLRGSAQSAPPDLARSERHSSPELDPRIPDPRYRVTRTAAPVPSGSTTRAPANRRDPRQDRREDREKDQDHAALEEVETSPFPQIRGERLERLFFSAPDHNVKSCNVCNRRKRNYDGGVSGRRPSWLLSRFATDIKSRMPGVGVGDDDEGFAECMEEEILARERRWHERGRDPPQTVLMRVVRELEDDFTHYKGIYVELSDQYKEMDAISNVVKRNVVAQHLKEVIDVLEQKGDQIASLHDLLSFQDKPVEDLAGRENTRKPSGSVRTW